MGDWEFGPTPGDNDRDEMRAVRRDRVPDPHSEYQPCPYCHTAGTCPNCRRTS